MEKCRSVRRSKGGSQFRSISESTVYRNAKEIRAMKSPPPGFDRFGYETYIGDLLDVSFEDQAKADEAAGESTIVLYICAHGAVDADTPLNFNGSKVNVFYPLPISGIVNVAARSGIDDWVLSSYDTHAHYYRELTEVYGIRDKKRVAVSRTPVNHFDKLREFLGRKFGPQTTIAQSMCDTFIEAIEGYKNSRNELENDNFIVRGILALFGVYAKNRHIEALEMAISDPENESKFDLRFRRPNYDKLYSFYNRTIIPTKNGLGLTPAETTFGINVLYHTRARVLKSPGSGADVENAEFSMEDISALITDITNDSPDPVAIYTQKTYHKLFLDLTGKDYDYAGSSFSLSNFFFKKTIKAKKGKTDETDEPPRNRRRCRLQTIIDRLTGKGDFPIKFDNIYIYDVSCNSSLNRKMDYHSLHDRPMVSDENVESGDALGDPPFKLEYAKRLAEIYSPPIIPPKKARKTRKASLNYLLPPTGPSLAYRVA
jgi:hypothetical protein